MATYKSADIFTDPAAFRRYVLPSLLVGGVNAIQGGLNGPRGRKGLAALRGGLVGGLGGLGIVGGREAAYASFSNPLAAYGAARFSGPIGGMLAFNAADRLIPQVQPLEDAAAVKPKTKQKSEPSPKKDEDMNAKNKPETKKQADATSALLGGLGGGVAGVLPGAGAGGLYGLLSGAYQAEKGKKLRGAMSGLGRGIVGGGLIGGGIGAGAGAGAGLMLPNGAAQAMVNPILAPIATAKMTMDPIGTASRAALGFVGGGAAGGYLGNKARKSMLGEPKQDEEKSEEKSEKKDNKSEEREERKAAGYKAADLTGLGAGALTMGGLGGVVGMPLGGLYGLASGAYQAGKGKRLSGAMRGLGRGIVGGGLIGAGAGAGLGGVVGTSLPMADIIEQTSKMSPDAATAAGARMGAATAESQGPVMHNLMRALALGGAAGGGYLGHKAYKKTVGPFHKDEDKEKKEAELKLSPLAGVKKPNKSEANKQLVARLEEARKKRQAQERDLEHKAAADGWRPFDYSNVGPGGLISERVLPKSDGTGGAKTWSPAVNAPQATHPSFQQPSRQPQQSAAPALAAVPQSAPQLPMRPIGYRQAGGERQVSPAAPAASAPAAQQQRRFASPLTLERVLPGQGLAPVRKSVENATGGFFGDGPQTQKGASDKQKPKVISFTGEKTPAGWKDLSTAQKAYYAFTKKPLPEKKTDEKKASAFEFGKMIKRADFMSGLQSVGDYAKGVWNSPGVQSFVNDPTTRAGLTYGGIGAGLGGLYGMINPGEYEDEMGNVRRRGRLMGALRGAAGGGVLGGLAGAGAQEGRFQYLKHLAHQANNASGVPAAPGMGLPTDRAGWQQYAEQFAPEYLKTSPLQSAQNAYSAVGDAVKGFMPKRMGAAPATGVETPAKAPEVKKTDNEPS